jgi:hypothetical protein
MVIVNVQYCEEESVSLLGAQAYNLPDSEQEEFNF